MYDAKYNKFVIVQKLCTSTVSSQIFVVER